ncbi:MAG: hypothetical protein GX557_10360, partial [Chloroflexi bacterium]|nr:hypothetical protein [Chloroflexota bacterium]
MAEPVPSDAPFAVVVVHTPLTRAVSRAVAPEDDDSDDSERLARAFHYAIPQSLRGVARPGQLVWVPFGARYLQGVIVALAEQSPVEQTRELDQIVDPTPVLSPVQLELARWISSYYLAPLHLAIGAMLPPGVTQTVQTVLEAVADVDLSTASADERSLYELVRTQGPLDDAAVQALQRRRGMRPQIERLVARGWLAKRHQVQPPAVRPKQVAVVRAAADAQPTTLPERATQQRVALQALCARRERGEGWLPLSEAAAEAGVAPATLRALVERGLVELELREIWRDPLAGRAFVSVDPPTLTPDQADVWTAIEADLKAPRGRPFLLQGVTGSGKTEIYLR